MKKAIVLTFASSCGLFALSSAQAQTTIFSDNFTADSTLAQPPWYNLNNTSAASYALNPTAGEGLALTVSAGTGKLNEMFAQFSSTPVTLSSGQYITLTVNFNSPSIGIATDTGGLLVGLYNDNGVPATGNEQGSSGGSTATGGATAPFKGYFGIMGYNAASGGTSTKFYSRQGGASVANELAYYSSQTSGSYTQVGSSIANSGNAPLGSGENYTLTYTITDEGASGNQLNAVISQGATTLDTWMFTDTSGSGGAGLYDTFNELDFGSYGKLGPVNINILSESVVTTAPIPEPSTVALAGIGLGLTLLARFRRR